MAKRSREDFELHSDNLDLSNSLGYRQDSNTLLGAEEIPAISSKITALDFESGEAVRTAQMHCSLPPHRDAISFTSYEEYEVHYNKVHVNRCAECRKNFPTNHFLNLHIEECHDPLISVRRERGDKTYSCYVEDCDRKCSTPHKRRMHLIDKHLFPKDYNFFVTIDGIDNQNSMLQSRRHRRRSSAAHSQAHAEDKSRKWNTAVNLASLSTGNDTMNRDMGFANGSSDKMAPEGPAENDMEDLSNAMSALKVVPLSIRFGRGGHRGRGGFARN